jgi:hypothetical protein
VLGAAICPREALAMRGFISMRISRATVPLAADTEYPSMSGLATYERGSNADAMDTRVPPPRRHEA